MKSLLLRALLLAVALLALPAAQAQNTLVRLHTTQGPLDIKLLDTEAPVTVANFLAYLRGGDYTDVLIHRSAWSGTVPFVIQGGGYVWPVTAGITPITSRGKIINEFHASRSNVRGTVAMAKLGGDPNSATSQWFVNMSNNSANLDAQNGGFTVFGRVTTPGMLTADKIAAFPRATHLADSPYYWYLAEMPLVGWTSGPIYRSNAVLVSETTEFAASPSDSDRIFNYLEAAYPQYILQSKPSASGEALGYQYRYYAASNAYVGTKDGKVWYLLPAINNNINELGAMADWLATAEGAGY